MGVDPLSLSILSPPSKYDADIVVGEGQTLGSPTYFGGPLLGIFGVKGDMRLIRNMPGRIMGLTKTMDGQDAFAMILQTREQHIRRERATSNICSNEALTALATAVYLSILGRDGLLRLSLRLLEMSHKLYEGLSGYGFEGLYDLPYFREFSLRLDSPVETRSLISTLVVHGILFGYVLGRGHVISVNEYHSDESFGRLYDKIGGVISGV
jgi:glycine dehydrogenase subunit 1